jgi:protein-tyrosine phosphatase-like protein
VGLGGPVVSHDGPARALAAAAAAEQGAPGMATSQQTFIPAPGTVVDRKRSHATLLRHAAERLSREFAGTVTAAEVRALLDAEYARLAATAHVKDFLPVFAERAARERCKSAGTRRQAAGVA